MVMLAARTTPEYLLSWQALTALGAVTVPVNPASAPAEMAGLVGQVRPKAILTDPAMHASFGEGKLGMLGSLTCGAGAAAAVLSWPVRSLYG